jgi:hypothetical protein
MDDWPVHRVPLEEQIAEKASTTGAKLKTQIQVDLVCVWLVYGFVENCCGLWLLEK